jgi:MFS family permease
MNFIAHFTFIFKLANAHAPNSTTLIVGRAIAGMGSSGIFSGAMTIVVYLIPLQNRPAWTGSMGAVFALASIAGPLLGGVFVDKLSWRWCFYINLPIGGFTMVVLAFVLHLPTPQKKA